MINLFISESYGIFSGPQSTRIRISCIIRVSEGALPVSFLNDPAQPGDGLSCRFGIRPETVGSSRAPIPKTRCPGQTATSSSRVRQKAPMAEPSALESARHNPHVPFGLRGHIDDLRAEGAKIWVASNGNRDSRRRRRQEVEAREEFIAFPLSARARLTRPLFATAPHYSDGLPGRPSKIADCPGDSITSTMICVSRLRSVAGSSFQSQR